MVLSLTLVQWFTLLWLLTGMLSMGYLWDAYTEARVECILARNRNAPQGWIIRTRMDRRIAQGRLAQQLAFEIVGVAILLQPVLTPGFPLGGIVLAIALWFTQGWYLYSSRQNRLDAVLLSDYLAHWDGTTERRVTDDVDTPVPARANESQPERPREDTGTNTQAGG